jgi:hypothetical protein
MFLPPSRVILSFYCLKSCNAKLSEAASALVRFFALTEESPKFLGRRAPLEVGISMIEPPYFLEPP